MGERLEGPELHVQVEWRGAVSSRREQQQLVAHSSLVMQNSRMRSEWRSRGEINDQRVGRRKMTGATSHSLSSKIIASALKSVMFLNTFKGDVTLASDT